MIRTTKLMEDYSSDEEPQFSPTYGALGTTTAGRRQRNGSTRSTGDTSYKQQKKVDLGEREGLGERACVGVERLW